MKLLVSQRSFLYEKYNENRDCIDQRMISWVLKLGYYPVLVPNNLFVKKNFLNLRKFIKEINPKGLILTGGEDIGTNIERDKTELFMINEFFRKKKAILGICRGMQIIGKYFNKGLKKSKLKTSKNYKIFNNKNDKNIPKKAKCFFNYSLRNCPNEFDIIAQDGIGTIWAIENKKSKCEAWMWHPERKIQFDKTLIKRTKKLFSK